MSKDDPTGRNTIYETMPIAKGVQKIPLLDTENIVGVTLVSHSNDCNSGRISKTLIFGALRQDFNVTLSGLDDRSADYVATIVRVTDDGIDIVGFNPRWEKRGDGGKSGIFLESMIVMRSIPTYAESYRTSDEPGFRGKARKDRKGGPATEEGSDYWLDKYRNG